jgi:hypothetical protein
LGSSRNWRSFSRKLAVEAAAKANRDVRVLLLDLRCHGDSAARFGFHPPHDMAAAASDVAAIIQHELQGQAPHLLVGLSLGGKVALQTLKQMVEAQEADQHQQQHLYERTPRIMPPADVVESSNSGASSSEPGLRGLPQQVCTSFLRLFRMELFSTCLVMLSPHLWNVVHKYTLYGCEWSHACLCRFGCWTASLARCQLILTRPPA